MTHSWEADSWHCLRPEDVDLISTFVTWSKRKKMNIRITHVKALSAYRCKLKCEASANNLALVRAVSFIIIFCFTEHPLNNKKVELKMQLIYGEYFITEGQSQWACKFHQPNRSAQDDNSVCLDRFRTYEKPQRLLSDPGRIFLVFLSNWSKDSTRDFLLLCHLKIYSFSCTLLLSVV